MPWITVGIDSDDHLQDGAVLTKVFTLSRERIFCRGLLFLAC